MQRSPAGGGFTGLVAEVVVRRSGSGGSNVLFMDGHVEFIRFGAGWPVKIGEWNGYPVGGLPGANLSTQLEIWVSWLGGMG